MELPYISQFTYDLFLGTFNIVMDLAFVYYFTKFIIEIWKIIFIKE